MRTALAQINPVVGDIDGNASVIIQHINIAREHGAHLVVFSELAVPGYPPKDFVLRKDFVRRNEEAVDRITAACTNITAIVGHVRSDGHGVGKGIFNAAAACRDGRIVASYAKQLLPTYDVFDETRYFDRGNGPCVVDVPVENAVVRVGLTICEDLWNDRQFEGRRIYGHDPIEDTVKAGAEVIINISASPYSAGKYADRETIFAAQIAALGVPLIYVNQVGGNDDLLFDGASLVLDQTGRVLARAKAFDEDFLVVDHMGGADHRIEPYPERLESIRQALVLGIRDYFRKCGFRDVVIGLSGGIDSAVTAALAVEALGAERVLGVAMPSRYSSKGSLVDAEALAANLGIRYDVIPIEGVHTAMEMSLTSQFGDLPAGIAEENIQARIRGSILMALSNKFGSLLLTTGNKSELAVGYCTLYGDMCGGLAAISDVPKTVVYDLARLFNQSGDKPCIPEQVITKPPSAELKENQTDQDTLPPYEVLDVILERHIERHWPIDEIVNLGFERNLVSRIVQMVERSEYKRKQAPVGLKVTSLAFGTGRRMPIAAKTQS